MRDEKGITLAALVITVIILMILASIAVYSGVSTVRYAGYNRAKNEMHIMQATVNEWYQEYENTEVADDEITDGKTKEQVKLEKFLGDGNKYGVTTDDSSCDQTALNKTVNATGITVADFRFLSENFMKNTLGLDGNCEFLVNIPERTVILFNGYSYNGKTYYTAEDFDILNVVSQEMDGITFSLAQGDNNDVIISDLKLVDTNSGSEADISKFIVQYKKESDTNWNDATASVVKYVEGNKTKFKFSVSEFGDYDVKISTTDKKNSNEKTVMIFEKQLTVEAPGIYISTIDYTDNTESDDTKILNVDGAMLLSAGSQEVPSRIENDKFVWRSSNTNVATVTTDGVVKCGTETGIATITLYGSNSTKSKCRVKTTAKIAKQKQDSNYTINGETGSDVNPTIPAGFYAIDTNITETTANNIDWKLTGNQTNTGKGLAIMNDAGDQFVWVPVPDAIYDSNRDDELLKDYTTLTSSSYTPMAIKIGDNYKSLVYNYESTSGIRLYYPTATNYQGTTTQCREPDVLSSTTSGDWSTTEGRGFNLLKTYITGMSGKTDDEIKIAWTNQLTTEYDTMVTQVSSYGGFWVGRYEESWDDIQSKVAVIAGARSADASQDNTKTWYGLYQKSKDYGGNNSYYESSMIYGSQYDAMMNWMAKNEKDVIATNGGNRTRITGNPTTIYSSNDKINNVVDIYGNSYEWTTEAISTNNRVYRGGYYNSSVRPGIRQRNYGPYYADSLRGSRPTLYLK